MDRAGRSSQNRHHDKWKRIIEPVGDSDSSDWSSDSEYVPVTSIHSYRQHESSLGNGSSSSTVEPQQPTLSGSTSKQIKQSQTSSIFRSMDSFMLEPSVTAKRYEGLDPGNVIPSSNLNHLLHHDYAEREVNSEHRISGETPSWYSSSMFNPFLDLGRKRKWFLSRSEIGPASVIDCSTTNSAPSTSTCGTTAGMSSEESVMQDPEGNNTSTSASTSGLNTAENKDDERWKILSSNRGMLDHSCAKKRALFESSMGNTSEPSVAGDSAVAATGGSGGTVPGSSVHTLTQSQAGQNDCTVTSVSMDSSYPLTSSTFASPSEWYVQKKVQSRCKEGRFSEVLGNSSHDNSSTVPEDYSHTAPRSTEDTSEIQVLSMAGPSNSTSRIIYSSPGARRPEIATEENSGTDPQGIKGNQQAEDEGVEVIMVDETQSETNAEKKANAGPVQEQQSTQKQQQLAKEEEERTRFMMQQRIEDELLNQCLLGLLECPVCMEYMGPPIHQCRRGHLVCSTCRPKLPSCPTCRSKFTETRNLAMEKVAEKLHYPCKNAHVGCSTTLRLSDKVEHEANCVFRSYRCVMVPPCEWRGQHNDILSHVRQSHASTLLQGPEHVLEMRLGDFTEQSSQNWIVSTLGELFRVNLGAVRGGRVQVFGCVLLLGPARHAPLFRYTLSVGATEGDVARRKMSYSRTTHCYVERCSVYYSAGDSFHLRTESAQLFSTGPSSDRVMCVKLKIEKVES